MYGTHGTKALERGTGLGELHEGQRAFLHAGPARCRHDHERDPLEERRLGGTGHLLADHGPHGSAHEREIHDAYRDAPALDLTDPANSGIAQAGGHLRGGDPVRVRLLVHEAEGIDALKAGVLLAERVRIQEEPQACPRREAEVVTAGGADAVGLVELLVEEHLGTRRAFRPEVRRVGILARSKGRQLDRHRLPLDRPFAHGVRGAGGSGHR